MSTVLSPVSRAPANPTYGKIQSSHLHCQAVVYVRQSTLQQVERHQESTRRKRPAKYIYRACCAICKMPPWCTHRGEEHGREAAQSRAVAGIGRGLAV